MPCLIQLFFSKKSKKIELDKAYKLALTVFINIKFMKHSLVTGVNGFVIKLNNKKNNKKIFKTYTKNILA